ncbi:putative bifunctional diguanylate cyclase/phosphodiesterase [Angustibacter sp. McL0619]|uniref:putative bifunctional diguanylate cyclase/phosphodiesterase n=1 Tax=Angustibacter sp. McL0619 TaxID=3415676 RepID=UPI003CF812F3
MSAGPAMVELRLLERVWPRRGDLLSSISVELSRALTSGHCAKDVADALVEQLMTLLPAVGVSVTTGTAGTPAMLATSDATVAGLETLQAGLAEGPGPQARRCGHTVVAVLGDGVTFPRFAPAAADAGIRSVVAVPLAVEGVALGVLTLYLDDQHRLPARFVPTLELVAELGAGHLRTALDRQDAVTQIALLRHRALHDPLTGLANRPLFEELLATAVARDRRSQRSTAVLFVDLDDFTAVNDLFGHTFGDRVLQAVAERLSAVLRPGDTLARLGEDEFVILCESLNAPAQAGLVAERAAAALDEPLHVQNRWIRVSGSVGVAETLSGTAPTSLLRAVDPPMHQAEAVGGRHQVSDGRTVLAADHLTRLEIDLRSARRRGELELLYQPIVRVPDRTMVGVEALLRWQHPTFGLVMPDVLVPVAERSDQIGRLGEWVLDEACRTAAGWQRRYGCADTPWLSVNVSAVQVACPTFSGTVARVIGETCVDPARLHLEITESVLLADDAAARENLQRTKALGVRLSLDDFGTGYASLAYLQRYPFDVLKVDRRFLRGVCGARRPDRAIVSSVIELAHTLDMTVISEGVETDEQFDQLAELGSDLAQGYLLSQPVPADTIERWLDSCGPGERVALPSRLAQ